MGDRQRSKAAGKRVGEIFKRARRPHGLRCHRLYDREDVFGAMIELGDYRGLLLFGALALGHVGQRDDRANVRPVIVDQRPGAEEKRGFGIAFAAQLHFYPVKRLGRQHGVEAFG